MMYAADTLLLRIRAETLRLNLQRAHSNLKDLPNISGQFSKLQNQLTTTKTNALLLHKDLHNVRQAMRDSRMPESGDVKNAEQHADTALEYLGTALTELEAMGGKSFLVQVKSVGKSIWQSLDQRAVVLQAGVAKLENNLSGPDAWIQLAEAGTEASDRVFHESVELLGGIALRDTRLDADICELADALVGSIPPSLSPPSVIPGSVSNLTITVESVIRLRFPEWTIWALPFAVHEFWRVSVRQTFNESLTKSLEPDGPGLVTDPAVQLCIGDAFATYIMGPAYAFAAITLLFDPRRTTDDLRVSATLGMLRKMDPSGPDALTQSYQTVARYLKEAWEAAKRQTSAAAGHTREAAIEAAVAALFSELESIGYRESGPDDRNSLRKWTEDLLARPKPDPLSGTSDPPAAAADPATPTGIEKMVETVFTILTTYGYVSFGLAEWKSVTIWKDRLLSGTAGEIELAEKYDLRHVLNAAWLARLDDKRTADISTRVTELAERVKAQLAKRSADGARGALRGLG